MQYLLNLDHEVFYWVINLPHTAISDSAAAALSGIGAGGLIFLLLSLGIFLRIERRDHWFFLPIVLSTALSELVTNIWLKGLFVRNRPPGANLPDFSFPSAHATFAFALAVVLSRKEPRLRYFYYALAAAIAFSRVYLGKHYPSDVAAGSFVGIIIGWSSLTLENFVLRQRTRRLPHRSGKTRSR